MSAPDPGRVETSRGSGNNDAVAIVKTSSCACSNAGVMSSRFTASDFMCASLIASTPTVRVRGASTFSTSVYTPEVLVRDFNLLGIESERLDGLILSHGHRDHYAGLAGFVAQYRERMRADLQLFVAVRKLFVKNGSACAMKSRFPGVRSTAQH
jgi:phosphoribosyl 1,2-cyclic phosphodiesterase